MTTESHSLLILVAYLLTFVVVLFMLARILAEYRSLKAALTRIEKRSPDGAEQ